MVAKFTNILNMIQKAGADITIHKTYAAGRSQRKCTGGSLIVKCRVTVPTTILCNRLLAVVHCQVGVSKLLYYLSASTNTAPPSYQHRAVPHLTTMPLLMLKSARESLYLEPQRRQDSAVNNLYVLPWWSLALTTMLHPTTEVATTTRRRTAAVALIHLSAGR